MQSAFTAFMLCCALTNAWGLFEAYKFHESTWIKTMYFLGTLGAAYAAIPPCP